MTFREGYAGDVVAMHRVRLAVRENVLSRPELVTLAHYHEMLGSRGKAFVCEDAGDGASSAAIVGFAVVDATRANVWALFVLPTYERRGIGKELLDRAMRWLCTRVESTIWLTTAAGSRAEGFYTAAGWRRAGVTPSGELRFEWELGRPRPR